MIQALASLVSEIGTLLSSLGANLGLDSGSFNATGVWVATPNSGSDILEGLLLPLASTAGGGISDILQALGALLTTLGLL